MALAVQAPLDMLHHRIAWSKWLEVINETIAGMRDMEFINIFLSLSPAATGDMVKDFKAAVHNVKALKPGKNLAQKDINALQTVEAEIFSLPINAFLGPTRRADDPANDMDFTPDDVDYAGFVTSGPWGDLQSTREEFYAALLKRDKQAVKSSATSLRKQWGEMGYDLSTPTAPKIAHWSPGTMPRTVPGYRHWINKGSPLSVQQSIDLTKVVKKRVETKK